MRDPNTPLPPQAGPLGITEDAANQLDQKAIAAIAQMTGGQPPTLNTMALMDWVAHLSASPGKQLLLLQKAVENLQQLQRLAAESTVNQVQNSVQQAAQGTRLTAMTPPAALPTPITDRRFSDPAWQQWPFNVMQQSFLMQEAWWDDATSGVRGVDPHHADWVSFTARQWLGMMAPSNFALTNPVVLKRTIEENGANLTRGVRYALEDMQRKMRHEQPPISDEFVVGRDVATAKGKVVLRTHLMELIQYSPTTKEVHPEPVLIVPAWIMKYYILDLSPENSMIQYLVNQGHTVFAISWKNPGKAEHNMGMEDYLNEGFFAAMDAISAIVPDQKVHATGYCLGGTLLSIGAATMARDKDERLASMTLFAAQTDFSEPGELALFIDESQLNLLQAQMAERGFLDASQMAGAFTWLRSYDLLWQRMVQEYLLGERSRAMDLMAWNADSTRMPARMHTEYLSQMFLHNDLARGRYLVNGRPVVLNDIRVPVYCVGTESDHVAPWKSVYKIHLLTDTEVTFVLTKGGHNAGIVSEPGRARRHYRVATRPAFGSFQTTEEWMQNAELHQGSWWEDWHAWLGKNSGAQQTPPSMGAKDYPAQEDAPGLYVLER